MRRALPLAFVAGIALFTAAPAHAEPVVTSVAEVVDSADVQRDGERFRHVGSGYAFPSSIGDMPARKVTVATRLPGPRSYNHCSVSWHGSTVLAHGSGTGFGHGP